MTEGLKERFLHTIVCNNDALREAVDHIKKPLSDVHQGIRHGFKEPRVHGSTGRDMRCIEADLPVREDFAHPSSIVTLFVYFSKTNKLPEKV